jgi:hypothetical protein
VDDEVKGMWKEAVLQLADVTPRDLSGELEQNQEKTR